MKTHRIPLRLLGVVALYCCVSLLVGHPFAAQVAVADSPTTEPTPRPTPTTAPYIEVNPSEAVAGQDIPVVVTGHYWPADAPGVTLTFDQADMTYWLGGPFSVTADGSFEVQVVIPAAWATVGQHLIMASDNQTFYAQALIVLVAPPPTSTPTATDAPTATDLPTATWTPPPSNTPTPSTPTLTPTPTKTPTPSPTARLITPEVTDTPTPRNTAPARTATSSPTPTWTLTATFTPTPVPTNTPGPTAPKALAPTLIPTNTPTPSPTATSTPAPTLAVVVLVPSRLPTSQVVAQMPYSGGMGQGTADQTLRVAIIVMLVGGVFMALFVAVLVVAMWVMFRYLRARGYLRSPQQDELFPFSNAGILEAWDRTD
jgi:hypothetical protein